MVQSTLVAKYGSQPACNAQLVKGPWHIPAWLSFTVLAMYPWVAGLLYTLAGRLYPKDRSSYVYLHSILFPRSAFRLELIQLVHLSVCFHSTMSVATSRAESRLRIKIMWTSVLGIYYICWIVLTEAYVKQQTLAELALSEKRFTQSQVRVYICPTLEKIP